MALLETDRISWKLTSDGELDFQQGMQFSSGRDGVAQSIRVRVLLFVGEFFANLEAGLDWHGEILGKPFNATTVRDEFRDVILRAPGAKSLEKLSVVFNSSTRLLTVSWTVLTKFGDTIEDSLEQAA